MCIHKARLLMRWPNHYLRMNFDTSPILCTYIPANKSMRCDYCQGDHKGTCYLSMCWQCWHAHVSPQFIHVASLISPSLDISHRRFSLILPHHLSFLASFLHSQAPRGYDFEQQRMHTHQRYGFSWSCFSFSFMQPSHKQPFFSFLAIWEFHYEVGVALRTTAKLYVRHVATSPRSTRRPHNQFTH